ncbi:Na(+)/H(+) exchange regulatory cofactor NHE-RF2 isoform X2 [Hoplias malabaricus]|uniref:Na(+)/H(+) exchange regulatory cofactor NHE-RF2 isoform X2 n=1 Tax=Hoplias malabaricus TaxID=27720 RepID=UPI0034628064
MADMTYSLEQEMLDRGLQPRLCYLTKGDCGFGFHLHGERYRGAQFIRKIEPGSPADLAGLRSGDRVVEVNGENVEKDAHHETPPISPSMLLGSLPLRADPISPPRIPSSPSSSHTGSECLTDLSTIPTNTQTPPISPSMLLGSLPLRADPVSPPRIPPSPSSSHTGSECLTDLSTIPTNTQEHTVFGEEDEVMQDLRPRLCCMEMTDGGYGFNLHCDKSRVGQFVRSVDPDSPAERAGLRPGDRVVQVNDRIVEGLKHSDVVALIRGNGGHTELLVVDSETDSLFKKLGITPTTEHLKEDCVDGPLIESPVSDRPITRNSASASPSPITESPLNSPSVVNVTVFDRPIKNGSLNHQKYGSSSSHSTLSETSFELSNNYKILDLDRHKRHSAPCPRQELKAQSDAFLESGLWLSPTAAEARQKAKAKRANKRAPPMDWSKKQQIFSNF